MNQLLDIILLNKEEIITYLESVQEPKFRARQILEWLWKIGVYTFDEMTNLPRSLREKLQDKFCIRPIVNDLQQISKDGTIKIRFKLHDGHFIESVLIPVTEQERFTVCISCQVGCSLTCSFCATGQMKRIRNLDMPEIVDQVRMVNQLCLSEYNHPITNIVYMGMGEPLLSYASVVDSVRMISSPDGLGISPRRITISTAGIAKMIKKLADEGLKTNLALSLHAADDEKRNQIMPINEQNNLETLTEALQYYREVCPDSKMTFEYISFDAFNDSLEDAKNLVKLCKKVDNVKVNIIEYNRVEGVVFQKSRENQLDQFMNFLSKNKIAVTLRKSRGKDIDAACGQLANKEN